MLVNTPPKSDLESAYPGRWQAIVFHLKASLLRLRRAYRDRFLDPIRSYSCSNALIHHPTIAESVTPLWTSQETAEQNLMAGKIENLRVAVRRIHGVEVPPGGVFSFWAQLGRPTRQRGYVNGRELRQGCIIPNVGGGLCQLSNALYSAALDAGLTIVERHAHTQVVPGSLAERDRDATVFWNYVDLRFQSDSPLRIEAFLTQNSLVVRFKGTQSPIALPPQQSVHQQAVQPSHAPKSCQTCGVTNCFRNAPLHLDRPFGKAAYLVDEYWAEFDRYLQDHRQSTDLLQVPLNGKRWKKANYAWDQTGFGESRSALNFTLERAIACRSLPTQGSSRQQTLLHFDAKLAQQYAALPYDVLHLTVMQNLLPFLWQAGTLGGRTYDVLMTRLPLSVLQQRLDRAHRHYPQSATLADFRSPIELVAAEEQALRSARSILTPHREIAALFPEKAILLDWQLPQLKTQPRSGDRILFPASTLGRKGAYELRTVAQDLGLELTVLGRELEGEGFWQGVTVHGALDNPLDEVSLVVLPAYVEPQPRLLLRAIAAGIPVIASAACGLENVPGVTTIPTGNVEALRTVMQSAIGGFDDGRWRVEPTRQRSV
jgi:hypothetical protein